MLFTGVSLQLLPERVGHLMLPMAQARIPVVLYRIVRAAKEKVCHVTPTILERVAEKKQDPILLWCPTSLLHQGIQLIKPALTALFTIAFMQFASYLVPVCGSNPPNHEDQI